MHQCSSTSQISRSAGTSATCPGLKKGPSARLYFSSLTWALVAFKPSESYVSGQTAPKQEGWRDYERRRLCFKLPMIPSRTVRSASDGSMDNARAHPVIPFISYQQRSREKAHRHRFRVSSFTLLHRTSICGGWSTDAFCAWDQYAIYNSYLNGCTYENCTWRIPAQVAQTEMSTTSSPTADEVRIVNYVLGSVSIAATLFRLFDRTRTRRLWWDDAWAGIAMIVAVMFMVAAELHLQDPAKHSRNAKIIIYYFCAQCFSGIIWSARISILFTIMRLTVPGTVRKLLWTAVCLFGLTWFILFAQVWWVCESQPGWKNEPATQCDLGRDVAIAQVITDVLSDAILIIAPMKLIWRVKLTQSQKIRLIAIFSTTGITTAVSLYHAYFVLRNGGLKEALAAVIEDGVSLIVVNLSVLIAFFFRITTESQSMRSRGTNVSDPKHTAVSITRTTDRVRDSLGISIVDISKPALEPETPTIKLDTFGQHDTGYDFKSPSPGL